MNISKHISYKEATHSITALRLGIDNTPNTYALQNMELLAETNDLFLYSYYFYAICYSSGIDCWRLLVCQTS